MNTFSMQLSVSGVPSAFDLDSTKDSVVVAAPGCLTWFKLSGHGTPRHVIHYEQPQQVHRVKFQREGGALLAALRAGVVSLWEPAKSLQPLIGHAKSSGWIADMSWSPGNTNLLATACDAGYVCLWDVRTPSWPIQQIAAGGICSNVDWCPINSNLVSVVAQSGQNMLVFDSRMVGSCASEFVANLAEVEGGITHASWCSVGQQLTPSHSSSAPSTYSLILGTGTGRLAYWDIHSTTDGASPSSVVGGLRSGQVALLSSQTGGKIIDAGNLLLAAPIGRGAVVCRRDVSGTAGLASYNLRLQGCPREKDPDFGPSIELNHSSTTSVVDMKWGTAGRLLPPFHSGLELLLLTESAALTAIRIPHDMVRKYCFPGGGSSSTLGGANPISASAPPSSAVSVAGPRHQLSSLKSNRKEPEILSTPRNSGSGGVVGNGTAALSTGDRSGDRFWAGIRAEILALEDAVTSNQLRGVSISRIDQYARQITIDMEFPREEGSHQLREKELLEQEQSYRHRLQNPSAERVVSLIVRYPSRGVPSFALRGLEGAEESAAGMEIITELNVIAESFFVGDNGGRDSVISSLQDLPQEGRDEGFLLAVAQCFRNNCIEFLVQGAGGTRRDSRELDESSTGGARGGLEGNNNKDWSSRGKETGPTMIDPLAYRVPSPACSGGRWSSAGVLVCFGGATITKSSGDKQGETGASRSYPKTLGDMLITERAREEAYAQQMAFLKHTHPHQAADIDSISEDSKEDSDDCSALTVERDEGLVATLLPDEAARQQTKQLVRSGSGVTVNSIPRQFGGGKNRTSNDSLASAGVEASSKNTSTGSFVAVPLSRSISGVSDRSRSTAAVPPRGEYVGLDDHLLPLFDPTNAPGQNLESLGEDLDLIAKAEARTAGFRRTLALSGENSERAMWLAAAAAAACSTIVSNSPTLLEFHVALSSLPQRLAYDYSLGPPPPPPTREGRCAWPLPNVKARAAACRSNAQIVSSFLGTDDGILPYSTYQIWSLLAVVLDLYAAAAETPDELASEGGAMLRWSESILGSSLLRRILVLLSENRDLQLLATCVCVLGGTEQTLAFMNPHLHDSLSRPSSAASLEAAVRDAAANPSSDLTSLRRLFDRALATYADYLCRIGALSKAAEVRKHNGRFNITSKDSSAERAVISLGVTCSRCCSGSAVVAVAQNQAKSYWCNDCRDYAVYCAVCCSSVRGTVFFCAACGHGGHTHHLKSWFEQSVECPSGCGCRCGELTFGTSSSSAKRRVPLWRRDQEEDEDDDEEDEEEEELDSEAFGNDEDFIVVFE